MKALKIYGLIWLAVLISAAIVYFGGAVTEETLHIFGFVLSTLIFMGPVAVLPLWLNDHFAPKLYKRPAYGK